MLNVPFVLSTLSRLFTRLSLLPVLLAGLLLPASAQVTYTGTTASQNFGSVALGSSKTVSFSFSNEGGWPPVGSIGVLTLGAPNMDFTNAAGTNCLGNWAQSTCTVNVTFTPRFAGLRMGAVVFFSGANNTGTQLANVPVYGVGTGPQINYGPGTATAVSPVVNGKGLSSPQGVAVDAAGDLFIADQSNGRVVEVPPGGGAATAIVPPVDSPNGIYLSCPNAVAVDGAGDLFIADPCGQPQVLEAPAGGGAWMRVASVTDATNIEVPNGLAVDGAGDLFISDAGGGGPGQVVELPAGGGGPIFIWFMVDGNWNYGPSSIAVNGAGVLFVAVPPFGTVEEFPALQWNPPPGATFGPIVNGVGLNSPQGVAVDAAGDLFIGDLGNNRVVEVPAGGGAAIAIDPVVNGLGLNAPVGVAVDGTGNLFIADRNNNRVVGIQPLLPAHFSVTTAAYVVAGSPFTLDVAALLPNGDIATPYDGTVSFSSSDPLFANPGPLTLTGGLAQTTVTLSTVGTQTITATDTTTSTLTGSGTFAVAPAPPGPDTLYLPAPGSVLHGPEVTFGWTPLSGATGYSLWIGSTGAGSNNLYNSHETAGTSVTDAGLPTNGETIYVRLYTTSGKTTVHSDYTYTSVTQAMLTAPAAGSVLAGPNVTFTWSAAAGATGYSLWLGSTGAGSNNLYSSHETTGTSMTVKGLPTNGETIYTRLYTTSGKITVYRDYTFIAQ